MKGYKKIDSDEVSHESASSFGLTKEGFGNLKLLKDFLLKGLPKGQKFDMSYYYGSGEACESSLNCGTSGCAAGYGPYAGIPKRGDENWPKYVERVFFNRCSISSYGSNKRAVFDFLFGTYWSSTDNTATGAGKRIQYFLKHGLPFFKTRDPKGLIQDTSLESWGLTLRNTQGIGALLQPA